MREVAKAARPRRHLIHERALAGPGDEVPEPGTELVLSFPEPGGERTLLPEP